MELKYKVEQKKASSICANHLFLVYISFLHYFLTLLIFSIAVFYSVAKYFWASPPLPSGLANTSEEVLLCHWSNSSHWHKMRSIRTTTVPYRTFSGVAGRCAGKSCMAHIPLPDTIVCGSSWQVCSYCVSVPERIILSFL
jgi:hypothetical protein